MNNPVDLKEFVSGFVLEADEHLHSINDNLVATAAALKQGLAEPRAVRELFRSLHTIKGLAAMVGAEPIVDISHEMENILRTADRAGGRLSEASLDLLVKGSRAVEERVTYVSKKGITGIPLAPKALVEALGLAQENQSGLAPSQSYEFELPPEISSGLSNADREQIAQAYQAGRRTVLVEFQPSPERSALGLNITSVRQKLGALGELIKVVPRSVPSAPTGIAFVMVLVTSAEIEAVKNSIHSPDELIREIGVSVSAPTLPAGTESESPAVLESIDGPEWVPSEHSSIRVDVRRLDDALERLSDLIVTRYKLEKVEATLNLQGVDTRELKAVIGENTRKLKRLREAITEARMVPLSELLQRLPLVVRGLTKDSEKSVNLVIQAGSAEVDKAVADKIFPAVVHLIRNAVDHAIETRAERKAAGKSEQGTITVICDDSSGTSLLLTIRDDGRGVNREAVARKAQMPVAHDNHELLNQLATPGLSTRDQVTTTSGRGMGMDIVKRSIEMLRGSFSMTTEPNIGTAFLMQVPVSITIVDVLSFVSGGQIFVAPIAMIDEILEIDVESLVSAPVPQGRGPQPKLIRRRSEAIPLLALDSILRPGSAPTFGRRALVVNQSRGAVAFGVDRLLGQQEVVVRALDDHLVHRPGIAGATDLGDGQPTLVLDLATLASAMLRNATAVFKTTAVDSSVNLSAKNPVSVTGVNL